MHRIVIAAIFVATLVGGRASAEDAPPGASKLPEPTQIVVTLTPTEATDLLAILDVAIKASGYSPNTLKALRIGQKLEQAGAGR